MGKYVVSPATHPTDCGRFRASFSVRRAQGSGAFRRVFRFEKTFASDEAARLFAVTQGWLRACMPDPRALTVWSHQIVSKPPARCGFPSPKFEIRILTVRH
jgi:hypothetical protein